MDDLLERVRATGLVPARRRAAGRPALGRARLDLPARRRGARWPAPARSGRCTSTTACAARRPTATREHCVALCERLGVALEVRRARGAAAATCRRWARELRYAAGAEAVAALGPARGSPPATRSPTRSRRSSTGWRPRRGGARCSGWRPRPGRLVRPLLAAEVTRAETAAWCEARGLAWREDASNLDRAYARARVREDLLPALRAVDARAEVNVLRTARAAARRGGGARRARRRRRWTAATDLARRRARRAAAARWAGSCCAAWPRTRPAASARARPTRLDDVLALGDDGALDLGDGARAIVAAARVRWAHACPAAEALACRPYAGPPDRRDPRPARRPQAEGPRPRRADLRRLRGARPAAGLRPQGRGLLPGRPHAPHRHPVRGRLHGRLLLRVGDRLLRRRADPQGPRPADRGSRRPDRRGHRRLRA